MWKRGIEETLADVPKAWSCYQSAVRAFRERDGGFHEALANRSLEVRVITIIASVLIKIIDG